MIARGGVLSCLKQKIIKLMRLKDSYFKDCAFLVKLGWLKGSVKGLRVKYPSGSFFGDQKIVDYQCNIGTICFGFIILNNPE